MDNDDARRRWGRPVRLRLNGSTTFPAGVLRLADRPLPGRREKPVRSRRGATGRCLLHDAATAASASITQQRPPVRAAACGGMCKRYRR
jgi:hypothetical protein